MTDSSYHSDSDFQRPDPDSSGREFGEFPAGDGSISRNIRDARLGRVIALEQLTDRYFDRLVGFADAKMSSRLKQVEDEEDVANKVLTEFLGGIAKGKYVGLSNRAQLWRMLAKMTVCRVIDHFDRFTAQKRGGGKVEHGGDLENDLMSSVKALQNVSIKNIDPQLCATLRECYDNFLASLDRKDRKIVKWHLEGKSENQIAWRLFFTGPRSVKNRLEKIFSRLSEELKQ